jgi:hypothetical protein
VTLVQLILSPINGICSETENRVENGKMESKMRRISDEAEYSQMSKGSTV